VNILEKTTRTIRSLLVVNSTAQTEASTVADDQRVPEPPRTGLMKWAFRCVLALIAAGVLVWAGIGAEIAPMRLLSSWSEMQDFIGAFASPEFGNWQQVGRQMLTTVQIAIWGSLLAVCGGVPFGILSSSNLTPFWICQPVRRLMDAARAINQMIFGMFFIAAVGLGPFAGVLAIFVHTLGTLAKLFSEAVEAIDPRPVEGIRATGAGRIEEIAYGVIPQVIPLWVSYSLYRFEVNVRAATVLGMVGAGGIGFMLWDSMRSFDFDRAATIILAILVTVIAIDQVSSQIRQKIV
jgi:phosphonate transport system permease protein